VISPCRSRTWLISSGQEQDFSDGAHDPENRQALWPSNYANTTSYQRIKKLNQVRHALISNGTTFEGKNFLDYQTKIIAHSDYDVAIRKGPLLAVLTNVRTVSSFFYRPNLSAVHRASLLHSA